MWKTNKMLALYAVCIFMLGTYVGGIMNPPDKSVEIVEVEKVRERVRVVTKIKERPDGSKETVIVEESQKESESMSKYKEKISRSKRDWFIGLSAASVGEQPGPPTYTLRVDRRILLDGYVGVYGRTDGEFGLGFSYHF